jgi:hypothetical protein
LNWEEIQAALAKAFRVRQPGADQLVVDVPMTARGAEYIQEVSVAPTEVQKQPWLAMISPVCSSGQLDLRQVLEIQGYLPLGAIVVRADTFLLRHGIPTRELTHAALGWNVAAFAREALKVRANIRQPADPQAFDYLAE